MLDLVLLLCPWWLIRGFIRSKFVRFALYLSIALRQGIAFVNSLPGIQLFGSGADARRFLSDVMSANWQPAGQFPVWLTDGYSLFIYGLRFINDLARLLVQILNPELTLQLLNVSVFTLSIVLVENRFGSRYCDRFSKGLLLFAFFYPFSLTFHTYVLRESFQLLLISLTLSLFDIPFRLTLQKIIAFSIILITAPVFHFTYPFPIVVSILLYTFLSGFRWGKISWSVITLLALTPLVLLVVNSWIGSSRIGLLSSDLSLSGAQETYLNGAILTNEQDETRTFYFDASSNLALLPLYYRMRPFLLEARNVLDFALFLSNTLALYIYVRAAGLLVYLRNRLTARQQLLLLSIVALVPYDLFWSVGTVNWGTSARHASATTVLLLILFAHYRQSEGLVAK